MLRGTFSLLPMPFYSLLNIFLRPFVILPLTISVVDAADTSHSFIYMFSFIHYLIHGSHMCELFTPLDWFTTVEDLKRTGLWCWSHNELYKPLSTTSPRGIYTSLGLAGNRTHLQSVGLRFHFHPLHDSFVNDGDRTYRFYSSQANSLSIEG